MNIFKLLNKPKKETPVVELAGKLAPAEDKTAGKREFVDGLVSTKDIIAPGSLEVDTDFIRIGNKFYRTVFTTINRRFVEINWLIVTDKFRCITNSVDVYLPVRRQGNIG
jgi:hypothetical protein